MFCTKCGEKNDDDAINCQNCGRVLKKVPPPPPVKSTGLPIWAIILIVGVVGFFVLGLVSAIVIPSVFRQRMRANEAAAQGGLKTIATGQTDYNNNSNPHTYTGELMCLGSGTGGGGIRYVDPNLANGLKSGYTYQMVGGTSVQGSIWTWSATAWPITYRSTGVRTYYIDESGIVRGEDIGGGIGTVAMPAVW